MESFENNSAWFILLISNGTVNGTEEFERLEQKKKVFLARLFVVLVSLIGIVGNGITIPALSRSKKLRGATTVFIVNLCVADLLYCCLIFTDFSFPSLSKNPIFCKWSPFLRFFVGGESICTILAITINRYVCVVHPSVYHSMYRPLYLFIMIFITWLYCLIVTSSPFFEIWGRYGYDEGYKICHILLKNGNSPVIYLMVTAVIYPTVTFIFCYSRIFWIVRKVSRRMRVFRAIPLRSKPMNIVEVSAGKSSLGYNIRNSENIHGTMSSSQFQREIRILKVILVVVIGFVLCYLPFAFILVYDTQQRYRLVAYAAAVGINISNVINPIIYVAMSNEYRVAYKELFYSMKIFGYSRSFDSSST